MKMKIYRFYYFLLPLIVIQECVGQKALLTLMEDKCITSTSSAMAMIYNLSDLKLTKSGELSKEVSQFKVKENDKGGIKDLCSDFECFNLGYYWKITSSLASVTNSPNNLITDRRWEDFPIFGTKHTEQLGVQLQYQSAATIHNSLNDFIIPFSIQVKEEAHIFLCDGYEVPRSNCYWFMLQAWNGKKTGFRKCKYGEIQESYNGRAPTGFCSTSTKTWEHTKIPKMLSEGRWNHFKIVKTRDEYKLTYPNGSVIITADTSDHVITPRTLFFHTKMGTGLWKVHSFNYIYTDKVEASLYTNMILMEGRNCLSMFVAMCDSCSMDVHFLTYNWAGLENEPLKKATVYAEDEQWTEVKICVDMTERQNGVYVKIISRHTEYQNGFWAFSNLRASNSEEIRVLITAYPEIWAQKCQFIRDSQMINLNHKATSVFANRNKCKEEQFGEDCLECNLVYEGACPRTTKYCQLINNGTKIQRKCYCSIGNRGENCKGNCASSYYGHGCQNSCKNCQNGCDAVSGICEGKDHFCTDNFVGDKCDIQLGIFIFDNLPDVEIGPTSCNLSVKSFSGHYYPKKPPLFYRFQYKEVNDADWKNVTEEPQDFNITTKVHLHNLKFESTYSIRVFGFNSKEDFKNFPLISNSIPFQNIRTTCYDLNENQIEIQPDRRSAKIIVNNSKETCDFSKYTISLNYQYYITKGVHNEFNVNNLEPFTEYTIIWYKYNNFIFTKKFQTKESEPEKVQHFEYSKDPSSFVPQLIWSKPNISNGVLLFYSISFQLEEHLACKEAKPKEKFTVSVPAENNVLRPGLKPYTKYNIEIKANTSAGYGDSQYLTVTTDSKETMATEEIPELDSINPTTEDVAFTFRMLQCEYISGPVYVNGDIRGMEPWCNHTNFLKTEELTGKNLVMKQFKPYCNYRGILQFYRKSGIIQKELSVNFKTLESVPNEIRQLEVTSKGINHISLRWLPSYPPTGLLSKYKLIYCIENYWKECNGFSHYEPIEFEPKPCKLWPDYHCYTFTSVKEEVVYTIKIESRNKGNPNFSQSVTREMTKTDDKRESQPPYGSTMSWTEDNYLFLTWYHPNATGGILKGFRVYVNNVWHDYELNSEEDYHLIYNITIKSNLTLPNQFTVGVAAYSLAGESNRTIITGQSPPPIPNETIKNILAENGYITITFNMSSFKQNVKRFLYVLITECDGCQENLQFYKDDFLSHHRNHDEAIVLNRIKQHHWKAIKTYDLEKDYTSKLVIRTNTSINSYFVKPNTKYTLAFIWVYKFGGYVRLNYTVISTTGEKPPIPISTATPIGKILFIILVVLAISIMALVYIRKKDKVHENIEKVSKCMRPSSSVQTIYDNPEALEPLRPISAPIPRGIRNSVLFRQMTDIVCPGNPLFKTRNSRRVKLDQFTEYVRHACESNELLTQHELFPRGQTKPWNYGVLPQNKPKNRYTNLVAYDHSRVILNKINESEHSDYINANYIDGYQCPKAYIATQGPKKNTVHDFWRMIWQDKVKFIVVLANVIEGGKKKTEQYWPNCGEKINIGDFTVEFLGSEIYANYDYRKFQLVCQNAKPRQIFQLHFRAWPDHGVPLYPQSLVPVLEKMLTFRPDELPMVIHCSAGVGRTGTIILCDICLRMAAAEGYIDVLAMLEHLRNQRPNMVDNVEQYKLAHLVILNCSMGLKTSIPINQGFAVKIREIFEENKIPSQLEYIRNSEWEDDAMKSLSYLDDEQMPLCPEKDRFSDIIPDKTSRVFLQPYPPSDTSLLSTYINAVQVDGFCEPGRFIVTQYPLPHTIGDFWRLVAEKDISVIICLNEIPSKDNSCSLFFPVKHDQISPVETITVKNIKNKNFQVYSVFMFEIIIAHPYKENKTRTVEIVKFRGWKLTQQIPDYMDFLTFVEDATTIARKSTPALITCYNGVSASGLFIAMSFLLEKIKLEQECDVCQAVRSIRNSRKQFTNTEEQLKFLYKASLLYVEEKFNQYSNMDLV